MTPKEMRNKRQLNRERKKRIWLIIRKLVISKEVLGGYSIHSYVNYVAERNRLELMIRESIISPYEKEVAKRFIKHAIHIGHCDSNLIEIESATNDDWPNDTVILKQIYENFKTYWDEVIQSYKKSSAKTKRIIYLIEKLNEDLSRSEIKGKVPIVIQIRNLINYYENLQNPS